MSTMKTSSVMDWGIPETKEYTGAGYELGALDVHGLADLYDVVTTISNVIEGLISQPRFSGEKHEGTPAGEILEQMLNHFGDVEYDLIERLKTIEAVKPNDRSLKARKLIEHAVKYDQPLPEVAALAARLSAKFVQYNKSTA